MCISSPSFFFSFFLLFIQFVFSCKFRLGGAFAQWQNTWTVCTRLQVQSLLGDAHGGGIWASILMSATWGGCCKKPACMSSAGPTINTHLEAATDSSSWQLLTTHHSSIPDLSHTINLLKQELEPFSKVSSGLIFVAAVWCSALNWGKLRKSQWTRWNLFLSCCHFCFSSWAPWLK